MKQHLAKINLQCCWWHWPFGLEAGSLGFSRAAISEWQVFCNQYTYTCAQLFVVLCYVPSIEATLVYAHELCFCTLGQVNHANTSFSFVHIHSCSSCLMVRLRMFSLSNLKWDSCLVILRLGELYLAFHNSENILLVCKSLFDIFVELIIAQLETPRILKFQSPNMLNFCLR